MDPPLAVDSDDSISRFGSYMMAVDPKSARHAVTGLASVIRILA